MTKAYQGEITRDGKFWLISIPAINRSTQARSLAEAPEMAMDLVSIMTGEDREAISVVLHLNQPVAVEAHRRRALQLRAVEAEARTAAATESRLAAHQLRQDGLTVRDIGVVLGISFQRAQQLLTDDRTTNHEGSLERLKHFVDVVEA